MLGYFIVIAVFAGALSVPSPNPQDNHEQPESKPLEIIENSPQIPSENPPVVPQVPCFIIPGYPIPYNPNVNVPGYGHGPCKPYQGYHGQAGTFEPYYPPQVIFPQGQENVPAYAFPQVPNGEHPQQPHGHYYNCYHYYYPYYFQYPIQPYYFHYPADSPFYQPPFESNPSNIEPQKK